MATLYEERLESALKLAAREIARLNEQNAMLRAAALKQCDITLDVVSRYAGTLSDLQSRSDDLQAVVDASIGVGHAPS